MISPVREVWRCVSCGSEAERDEKFPMGQYATGYCKAEKRNRPLIAGRPEDVDELVRRNQRRRALKTLNGQIARGTMAPHVYVKGEKPEGSDKRAAAPCAVMHGAKPCHWNKAFHPNAADLAEAWPT